jgi:hypothetical protein
MSTPNVHAQMVFCPTTTRVDNSGVHLHMYPQTQDQLDECRSLLTKFAKNNGVEVLPLKNTDVTFASTESMSINVNADLPFNNYERPGVYSTTTLANNEE